MQNGIPKVEDKFPSTNTTGRKCRKPRFILDCTAMDNEMLITDFSNKLEEQTFTEKNGQTMYIECQLGDYLDEL